MITKTIRAGILLALASTLPSALFAQTAPKASGTSGGITELEKFIVTESAAAAAGGLMPTSRASDSVFGSAKSVLDIPRSVTVLTPELMQKLGVRNFDDVARVIPGGERPNFYGVPGTPFIRGDFAGTFFNGMQRAFQRNEMPTSFGSLEGMDVVRGPAPGNYGPTQGGGFINFLPKSPYYDKFRGSLRTTVGTYDYFNTQLDVGGPVLAFNKPMAYRISLTNQNADSYYNNVQNNYVSIYGALKAQIAPDVSLFTGSEYYSYKSNENAGWNRVTQDLINNGNYIVGEVANRTSAAGGGYVVPGAVPFIGFGATAATIGGAQFDNSGGAIIPPASYVATLSPQLQALLNPTTGAYTAAFFNAGGKALTTKLEGNQVLADPGDFANAQNFLYFADLVNTRSSSLTLKNQFIIDYINTEKLSSYGYAFNMKQFIIEDKISVEQKFTGILSNLISGGSVRYSWAKQLQDFSAEPFSRRDISQKQITANSVVLSGPQRPAFGDTRNFWAQSASTDLYQLALFSVGELKFSDAFSTFFSARIEGASFKNTVPGEHERNARRGLQIAKGGKNYYMASVNPVYKIAPNVSVYASGLYGTSLTPSQGGNVASEANFGETGLVEGGVKVSLLDNTLFAALSVYDSTRRRFNNFTNAQDGLRSQGVELESTWMATKQLSFIANFGVKETQLITRPGYRFGATQDYYMPLLAGGLYIDFGDATGLIAKNNPDGLFAGSPQGSANLIASYDLGNGFAIGGGPRIRGSYYHNYERTISMPSTIIWNGNVSYRRGPISVFLELSNITSEDYFNGSDPIFAANTIITKGQLIEAKLNFTYKF
jgi:iron complex outermembrane recepter protein